MINIISFIYNLLQFSDPLNICHSNFVTILIYEVFMWISTLYMLYAFYCSWYYRTYMQGYINFISTKKQLKSGCYKIRVLYV